MQSSLGVVNENRITVIVYTIPTTTLQEMKNRIKEIYAYRSITNLKPIVHEIVLLNVLSTYCSNVGTNPLKIGS